MNKFYKYIGICILVCMFTLNGYKFTAQAVNKPVAKGVVKKPIAVKPVVITPAIKYAGYTLLDNGIYVKYNEHDYGCKNQAEYDKVLSKVWQTVTNSKIEPSIYEKAYMEGKIPRDYTMGSDMNLGLVAVYSTTGPVISQIGNVEATKIIKAKAIFSILSGRKNEDNQVGEISSAYNVLFNKEINCDADSQLSSTIWDIMGLDNVIMREESYSEGVVNVGKLWWFQNRVDEKDGDSLTVSMANIYVENYIARNYKEDPKYCLSSTNYNNDAQEKEIEALSNKITLGATTDYDKVLKIHDWVAENIYYNYDGLNSGDYGATDAYGTMKNKMSVCEGYAELTKALIQKAGIPCRLVTGKATGNCTWADITDIVVNHAWNEAFVDGNWLILDTTWDSSNRYENGNFYKGDIREKYFNITLEKISIDHKIVNYN